MVRSLTASASLVTKLTDQDCSTRCPTNCMHRQLRPSVWLLKIASPALLLPVEPDNRRVSSNSHSGGVVLHVVVVELAVAEGNIPARMLPLQCVIYCAGPSCSVRGNMPNMPDPACGRLPDHEPELTAGRGGCQSPRRGSELQPQPCRRRDLGDGLADANQTLRLGIPSAGFLLQMATQ